MRILVTNDDGVDSPGLVALVQALRRVADVDVIAPDRDWSTSGQQRTVGRPVRVRPAVLADSSPVLTTDGGPPDCVYLALAGLFDARPALVVAGIDRGSNVGFDVGYSGTVAAAVEAAVRGVPAIAVALADRTSEDFGVAADFVVELVDQVARNGLSTETVVNVNVPAVPADQVRGVAITSLGSRLYDNRLDRRLDPFRRPYYWLQSAEATDIPEVGTDIAALREGFISITPLLVDRTHPAMIEELRRWTFARSTEGGRG